MRSILAVAAAAWLIAGAALGHSPARTVAVTFDDLPYQASAADLCDREKLEAMTSGFIAMLRPLDTKGAVFVNEGRICDDLRAELMPGLLGQWREAGLELGNHTFSHPWLHRVGVDAYLAEVDRGAPVTRAVLAERGEALTWFRHPFLITGETPEVKAAVAAGLAERGYVVAPVTIDNNDWMFAAVHRDAEARGATDEMRRIGEAYVAHMATVLDHFEPYSASLNGGREPAQVLLLHANSLNRDWYPEIHQLYLERGYRFVPLAEALDDPIYARPDAFARRQGVSWLHRWAVTEGREPLWEPEPPQWIRDAYAEIERR